MNIFKYIRYQEVVEKSVKMRKKIDPKFTFRHLSQQTGIQNTYLTNVIKGRSELNSDQMYLICKELNFNLEEQEYMLLLLDYSRCYIKERKELLLQKIQKIQAEHLDISKHLEASTETTEGHNYAAEYFLDPLCCIIHLYFEIPKYANNPSLIQAQLGIPKEKFDEVIKLLIEMKALEYTRGQLKYKEHNYHLNKESHLNQTAQILMKIKSIEQLEKLGAQKANIFSATFSANDEVKTLINDEFLKFLKKTEKWVKEAKAEKVYQLNFDLFPWHID